MNIDDLYRLLRAGHVQAQGIVDTIADPLLVLDSSLCVQSASRAFFETFKVDRYETIGQPLYELGNGQWNIPDLRRLLVEVIPKATAVVNYEVEHDFPGLGPRIMLLTARTVAHQGNASHTMLLSITDATDSLKRAAAKDMLFGELRHRVKKLLGLAQAIARQTATTGRTAEDFRDEFLGRFRALTEAHDVAFGGQSETGLRRLVDRILAPFATPESVVVSGDGDVDLGPQALLSLSLVLHELTTNAAKYGALSVSGGQVHVDWTTDAANAELRLTWVEKGGPPVAPPDRQGYGTQLIESSIVYSLGGRVEQNFASGGLVTELTIPLPSGSPESDAGDAENSPDRRR